jgi:hypothetical protein
VNRLVRMVGWSSRLLSQRFHAEFGLTPKAAARVVRFDRARRLLQRRAAAGQPPALADLARARDMVGSMSDTAPAPQVWPTLRARDARALIRFASFWPLAFRWAPMGLSPFVAGRAACLAPRLWRSSRSQAGIGSGPPGRGPMGAQPVRCRPRDRHRAPPERKKYVRPSWTQHSESTGLPRRRI